MDIDSITFEQILNEDIKPGMIVISPEEYQRLIDVEQSYKSLLELYKEQRVQIEEYYGNSWERSTYD